MGSGTRQRRGTGQVQRRTIWKVRLRVYLTVAAVPVLIGYTSVALLLALIIGIAPQAQFSVIGTLSAAGPAWLAAHQVPIEIAGRPLGVLPLVPTIALCLLVARSASAATRRLRQVKSSSAPVIAFITAAHALPGIPIAMLADGAPLQVELLSASLMPALLAGGAATAGVIRGRGGLAVVHAYLDPPALHGLRMGLRGLAALLGAGMLTFGVATALSASTVRDLIHASGPEAGSAAGVILLSLGYVPNAVILTLGFLTGPGLSIGTVSVSPFTLDGGPLPALPVLAGIPEHSSPWWPVFLILPATTGLLVGRALRHVAARPVARLRAVGVAGAVAGLGVVVLGTLAGGRLADGAWDPVSYPPGLVSLAVFCWLAVPGALVSWFGGPRRPQKRSRARSGRRGTPPAPRSAAGR